MDQRLCGPGSGAVYERRINQKDCHDKPWKSELLVSVRLGNAGARNEPPMKRQRCLDFAENARKWVAGRAINSDGLYLTGSAIPGRTRAARRPIEGASIASVDLGHSGESCASLRALHGADPDARDALRAATPCEAPRHGRHEASKGRLFVEARHDEKCLRRRRRGRVVPSRTASVTGRPRAPRDPHAGRPFPAAASARRKGNAGRRERGV